MRSYSVLNPVKLSQKFEGTGAGSEPGCYYEFEGFRLDPLKRLLWSGTRPISLHSKVFDLLVLLVQSSPRVLAKSELMQALWPETTVEESNLTQSIFVLRRALGESAGERRFIVTVPGRGYRFVAPVRRVGQEPGASGGTTPAATPGLPSIAVLPFRCLSSEPGDEYLGYGIAETLSDRLASTGRLLVRPAASVGLRQGRGEYDPVRAGRSLGVASVVCGTFQRCGGQARVNVRIVRVRDGSLDWTKQLESSLTDIFAFQDAIAEQVANAIALKLTSEESSRLRRHHVENIDAYLSYLRGRYFWNKRTPEGLRKAARCFERAVQEDRTYALAYAGLADVYNILASYSIIPPSEAWPRAKEAALRALEINDQLAEAHAALGLVLMASEWAWSESAQEFQRALALNPGYAFAIDCYAEYCSAFGHHQEAIVAIRRAQELEPLSLIINCDVAWILFRARRFQEALEQMRHSLDMDPNYAVTHWTLGWCYDALGINAEAQAHFEEALRLFDEGTPMLASLGHACAAGGDHRKAREILERLLAGSHDRYASPYDTALLCVALGERERAFELLQSACEERPYHLIYLKHDPRVDPLRPDARFDALLMRMGLGSP